MACPGRRIAWAELAGQAKNLRPLKHHALQGLFKAQEGGNHTLAGDSSC